MNIKVIAEGVENEAQLSFLRAHQCGGFQGYYYSQPLTVDKLAARLFGHPAGAGGESGDQMRMPAHEIEVTASAAPVPAI